MKAAAATPSPVEPLAALPVAATMTATPTSPAAAETPPTMTATPTPPAAAATPPAGDGWDVVDEKDY